MKRLLIFLFFISFYGFSQTEEIKKELISNCICDYRNTVVQNYKDKLNEITQNKNWNESFSFPGASIYSREEILYVEKNWEEKIAEDKSEAEMIKLGKLYLYNDFSKIKNKLTKIIQKNSKESFSLPYNISSNKLLKYLNTDLYKTEKKEIISLKKDLLELQKQWSGGFTLGEKGPSYNGILFDCVIDKNYDKYHIISFELKSSLLFQKTNNLLYHPDYYYKTRLTFNEAKEMEELGFYFLREFASMGYLIYLFLFIILYINYVGFNPLKLKSKERKQKTP